MFSFFSVLHSRFSCLCVAAALAIAVTGCGGGYVSSARSAYGEGRYFEAAERLAAHEGEVGRLSAPARVDYGLYRGLALLAVGDHAGASQWLGYARDVSLGDPDTLSAEGKALLDRGLGQLQTSRASRGAARTGTGGRVLSAW